MKNVKINNQEYEVIENDQECLNIEEISENIKQFTRQSRHRRANK